MGTIFCWYYSEIFLGFSYTRKYGNILTFFCFFFLFQYSILVNLPAFQFGFSLGPFIFCVCGCILYGRTGRRGDCVSERLAWVLVVYYNGWMLCVFECSSACRTVIRIYEAINEIKERLFTLMFFSFLLLLLRFQLVNV